MSDSYSILIVRCPSDISEILIAELSEAGLNTFLEMDDGFEASSDSDLTDNPEIDVILQQFGAHKNFSFEWRNVEKQNWNKVWEYSYVPVLIDEKCLIRTDFHIIDGNYPYEIIINPKMSFGTGHHETTNLMISMQLEIDHNGKRVLDVGTGTGILAIMAEKLGAKEIVACDIDRWAVENSHENIKTNNCRKIDIYEGTVEECLYPKLFDIILANINKNVLLLEMGSYCNYLTDNAILITSGFLEEDVLDMEKIARGLNLTAIAKKIQNNWAVLAFQKKTA
jgi:ribosomal protein L11 methyltransferase